MTAMMTEFFQSSAAWIGQMTAFVLGFVALIGAVKKLREEALGLGRAGRADEELTNCADRLTEDLRQLISQPNRVNDIRHGVTLTIQALKDELRDRLQQTFLPQAAEIVDQAAADALRHEFGTVTKLLHDLLTNAGAVPSQALVQELLRDGRISGSMDQAIRSFIAQRRFASGKYWMFGFTSLAVGIVLFAGRIATNTQKPPSPDPGIPASASKRPETTAATASRKPEDKSKNEYWTEQAFTFFREGEQSVEKGKIDEAAFDNAIRLAKMCTDDFDSDARVDQQKLIDARAPKPKERYDTQAEIDSVLERGLINDVGTCYWIIGRSSQYLGKSAEARDAYKKAAEFVYAATWDPNRLSFWHPGQNALDRLEVLDAQPSEN